mgnify:CR=1 FL=1
MSGLGSTKDQPTYKLSTRHFLVIHCSWWVCFTLKLKTRSMFNFHFTSILFCPSLWKIFWRWVVTGSKQKKPVLIKSDEWMRIWTLCKIFVLCILKNPTLCKVKCFIIQTIVVLYQNSEMSAMTIFICIVDVTNRHITADRAFCI